MQETWIYKDANILLVPQSTISESLKNAPDAYAENVIVDYFRSDKLFVLRDDGNGMTKKDFEEKWLTLGTTSKLIRNIDETFLHFLRAKACEVIVKTVEKTRLLTKLNFLSI